MKDSNSVTPAPPPRGKYRRYGERGVEQWEPDGGWTLIKPRIMESDELAELIRNDMQAFDRELALVNDLASKLKNRG